MRKFTLILMFSLIAFVILIIGAGTATAIFYRDPTSPGKAKAAKTPAVPSSSEMTQAQLEYYLEQNGIDYYYIGYGDPQSEYISHPGGTDYYKSGGEGDAYYYETSENVERNSMLLFYLHREKLEKDDDYGYYYYD